MRDAILDVLLDRGLVADDEARSLLAATDDPGVLRRRLARAATATTTEEVFADE